MDTIFMNSKNSKNSEYHVLVLKVGLSDRMTLRFLNALELFSP